MILIDKVLINEDVFSSNFSCDLKKCKGACCTFQGDSGAPVTKDEINQIKKLFPIFKKYLNDKSLEYIKKNGFWEEDGDSFGLKCINDRDCVFVYYEDDIAKCAIEKSYHNNEINFRKPLSCHLFPIRIGNYGGDLLHYEQFQECEPGRENGEKNNISLIRSLKSALIRKYDEDFYNKLELYLEIQNK